MNTATVQTEYDGIKNDIVLVSFMFLAGRWGVYAWSAKGGNYCVFESEIEQEAIDKCLSFGCNGVPMIRANTDYCYSLVMSLSGK